MRKNILQVKLSENGTIKSTELVEIINSFRQLESESTEKEYKELQHKDFMKKIRKELEVLESVGLYNGRNFSLVEYVDKKGEKRPCFELNKDGMLQMLNSESVLVRYKTIEYINKLEDELNRVKSIPSYCKALRDLADKIEENERLQLENAKKDKIIDHKEDVIVGLVDKISIADKRQVLNRVVRYKGANYRERWSELYKQFEMKYHIDINRRIESYNSNNKPKIKSKLDYIEKIMNKIPDLYEIACKLYENDIKELVNELYGIC